MLSKQAALLIIDVQKAIDHPCWGRRNNPSAEANIALLLAAWRSSKRPVIHVRHVSREPESTYRPGQEGVQFKSEARPVDGETIITKHTNCAFIGTDLEKLLRGSGIGTLVICGVITNNSVETTARMAGNLDFDTYVVCDATATFDKVDFSGRRRMAEEVHDLSLANLQGEYARILSTTDILDQLQEPVASLEARRGSGREVMMIAYCGLNCSTCDAFLATQNNDDQRRQVTAEKWSQMFHADIAAEQIHCEGCKADGVRFFHCQTCEIRRCCISRGVGHCAACVDYICETLAGFIKLAPEAGHCLAELRSE